MGDLLVCRDYAVDVADVDEAGRRALVRIVPYSAPAEVVDGLDDPSRGLSRRLYREAWAPGAFRHAVKAPHRVPFVLGVGQPPGKGHTKRSDPFADVGRAVELLERDDALYGTLLVDAGPFGDHTLAKITSGQWRGISVGAKPLRFRDQGDPHAGGTRLRTLASLDHVLLTEHPAYSGAEVMAVREDPAGSPRLAAWRVKYPAAAS